MRKLGLVIIISSFLPWVVIFAIVPFLSFPLSQKALLVAGLIASGDILFWVGVLLVGKEVVQRYYRYFNPRFLKIHWEKIWRRRT
jgi:predicted ABC-type exoprotein transport system permease subunit